MPPPPQPSRPRPPSRPHPPPHPRSPPPPRSPSLSLPLSLALLAAGCLPPDDRPEPGSVELTVERGTALALGFATADGWTVGFERFVAAIGNLRLEGDRDAFTSSCNAYSSPSYDRTFDFAVLPEPAKVALAWGLGRCSVAYRVRSPSFDTLLGPGVTPTDVALMRVRGDDAYEAGKRVVLYAEGRAERGAVAKRFAWVFRRGFALDRCLASSGSGYLSVLELAAGDAPSLGVVVRGEELFRRAPDDGAPLHFDRYAEADADGDGAITFAELAAVAAPSDDPWPDDATDGTGEQPATPPETLADLVYRFLLPRVTRMVGGGVCQVEVRG